MFLLSYKIMKAKRNSDVKWFIAHEYLQKNWSMDNFTFLTHLICKIKKKNRAGAIRYGYGESFGSR